MPTVGSTAAADCTAADCGGRGGGKVTALVDSGIARTRLLGFPFYVVLGNPFLYSLHCDTII